MKTQNTKQAVKIVSTLGLFIALSVGAVNVWAIPPDPCHQVAAPTAQTNNSFSSALFLAQLATTSLYLP
jgi:hypothetical protein